MSNKYKFHNPDGIYFVSFAVVGWVDVFIRNIYKEVLIDSLKYCQKEKGLVIYGYVIMTNHVHLIIIRDGEHSLPDILRDLKKYTAYRLIGEVMSNPSESRRDWMLRIFEEHGRRNSNNSKYQFWQQDNHPIELSDNLMMDQKLDYLHNNPVKAGFIDDAFDWVHSSARDYRGEKGLLDVCFIE